MKWLVLLIWFQLVATTSGCSQNARVNRGEAVRVGNLPQWIQLRGDTTAPVLLFLHGGPGNTAMPYADRFTRQLQEQFLVVQWDQRGAGETARINPGGPTPTVKLMVGDAVEMVNLLAQRFRQPKIFLAGHSWGGFLALMAAREIPNLLHACIAISPMVSQQQSESLALEWMQGEAQKQHRTNATAELGNVKIPFETAEHLYLHRKWLALLSGRKAPERAFVFRWSEQWLPLFVEASRIDLFSTAPTFRCPIWLIAGTKDFQCHYEITKKYADHLVAPSKEIVLLPGAAHAIPSSHGALLQEHIIRLAQTVMH